MLTFDFQYTDYPTTQEINAENAKILQQWTKNKQTDISTYRDHCFKSPATGTMAIPLYAPWLKAFDDSLEGFLNSCSGKKV